MLSRSNKGKGYRYNIDEDNVCTDVDNRDNNTTISVKDYHADYSSAGAVDQGQLLKGQVLQSQPNGRKELVECFVLVQMSSTGSESEQCHQVKHSTRSKQLSNINEENCSSNEQLEETEVSR